MGMMEKVDLDVEVDSWSLRRAMFMFIRTVKTRMLGR